MPDIVLMADPRIAAVPVHECGEPLRDVRTEGLAVDDRKRDPAGAFAHVRAGLLERLVNAQERLPRGLRLLVFEGYRPPALQRRYFEAYLHELTERHPAWTLQRRREAASRFVAPPEIAPHCAGAAVDLTLCTTELLELNMGTPVNASPEESDGACYTAAAGLDPAARANRQLLCQVLTSVGLVNYPTEWWHWSYGDRYWALSTGAPPACYGSVAAVR